MPQETMRIITLHIKSVAMSLDPILTDSSEHAKNQEDPYNENGMYIFDRITLPVITDANLHINNIDYDISDDVLYNIKSQLGEITSHHIVRDATKKSRGFGLCLTKLQSKRRGLYHQDNGHLQ
jgi:hypothetical protein